MGCRVHRRGRVHPRVRSRISHEPYRNPDHELWPGLLDGLPAEFRAQLDEPAFSDETDQFLATAVLWRLADDDRWHAGRGISFPPLRGPYDDTGPDGTGLLTILTDDIVDAYVAFADGYHEQNVDRSVIEHVVEHRPLTDIIVQALNPDTTVVELRDDLAAIGYPTAAG